MIMKVIIILMCNINDNIILLLMNDNINNDINNNE